MGNDILVNAAANHDWFDYLTLICTIAGIVILAYYTWYTKQMMEATKASLKHAQESSAEALEETRKSNESTMESNRIAVLALELSQRAWLALSEVSGDEMDFITIEIKNTGGIPANTIEMEAEGTILVDKVEDGQKIAITAHPTVRRSLGNGESTTAFIRLTLPNEMDALSRIRNGKDQLIVTAVVSFYDAFQKRRVTSLVGAWLCVDAMTRAGRWCRFNDNVA